MRATRDEEWNIRVDSRPRCSTHPDRLLSALAARQGGVVCRAQLLGLGVGAGALKHRLRTGHLHPVRLGEAVLRGVYAVGRAELSPAGTRWAALLATGPEAALAGHTAAAVLGLLDTRRLDLIVPRTVRRKLPKPVAVRRVDLDTADVEEHDGPRHTRWPRACLDVAASGTAKELRIALDRTVTLRLFDLDALTAMLARYPRAHGTPALLRALEAMTDDGDRSERGLEDDLLELTLGAVASGRLPRPEVNALVEGRLRGDLVWRDQRLIVEADGRRWHDGPFARERDHERQAVLEAAGWLVLRIRWADVHRHPERTLQRVAAALARNERRRA